MSKIWFFDLSATYEMQHNRNANGFGITKIILKMILVLNENF